MTMWDLMVSVTKWNSHGRRIVLSYPVIRCVNRLKSLQRRLLKEPELIQEYHRIIEDQISQGIVEKVPAEQGEVNESETVHYLPHHGVVRRDRETTKLRIVYDGSAKPPGCNHSLNDFLQTGPNYTPQLFDTLENLKSFILHCYIEFTLQ